MVPTDYPQSHLGSREFRFYRHFGKRVFDIGFAAILLPLFLPVILMTWLFAKADGGPGFYGHRRIGKNGRVFTCWKIRTMRPNADALLKQHLADHPEKAREWASTQKLRDDPRITRLGAFLRATSLDELPQIWNVLTGDMSFVGPRPVIADELRHYGSDVSRYLALRPGITGLWQVHGRANGCYIERVRFDTSYERAITLSGDLLLILSTAIVIFRMTGR